MDDPCRICGGRREVQGVGRDGEPKGNPIPCPECNIETLVARFPQLRALAHDRLPETGQEEG